MADLREGYLEDLLSSHDIQNMFIVLMEICNRITVMNGSVLGICGLADVIAYEKRINPVYVKRMLGMLFASWDKHSCDPAYPVSAGVLSPCHLFIKFQREKRDMWDRNTEYGNNRRDLLLHCINEVTTLGEEIHNGLQPPTYKTRFNAI